MRTSLAVVLLTLSAATAAQELGTLFYSPKERDALERLRRGETADRGSITRPDPVVTGYVKRSDGKSTVFLDKQPFPARSGRMQELIEPGIIERFEPVPPLPEPAAPTTAKNGEGTGKPAPPKKSPVAPPKGGVEE